MNRRQFITTATGAAVSFSLASRLHSLGTSSPGLFSLPPLPYAADALAPHIDERTMQIHHGKHHAGYTTKLNAALAGLPEPAGETIEAILANLKGIADPATRTAVRNNGGGFFNHKLFWEVMAPENATGNPSDALTKAVAEAFGSMQQMQEVFTSAAASQFGSGWAWLVVRDGKLIVTATPNQDNPLMTGIVPDAATGTPILGVDVWEHAYYLNYQNRRGDYLNAWWNVVNWDQVSRNFEMAKA